MSDALLWNEIGNLYLQLGSPKEAIASFVKAIEINPESGWAYCNLGRAYSLLGEFGHALFVYRKSIQFMETPENLAMVLNKIGDAYRALKDIDNAIQAYKKADDLDMGAALAEPIPDRQSVNLSKFREMIKPVKITPEGNRSPSELKKEENHLPQERPEPTLPVSPQPNKIRTQNIQASNVGSNLNTTINLKEVESASLPLAKSLVVIPDPNEGIEHLPQRGPLLSELGQERDSETADMQDKKEDGTSKSLSDTRPDIENLEEILAKINIYENITRVNRTSDRAWDTLGKLYKSLGRHKDAIGAYQKAIEIAPDRDVYYYYLGLLYSVEQQHDDAVRAFLFVLRKNPDYVLAHSALAGVYHRMGLENKANHHIAAALPKMNNESAYNRACFYAICGDTELAFEFLKLALKNKDTTIEWIKADPDLDPIRTDKRYQELISGKDQPVHENTKENYFSSELEGKQNKLLPILNNSLAR